jgi:hypothetical protein
MGVPTSEVCYTSATTGRGDHEVHKGHVAALREGETCEGTAEVQSAVQEWLRTRPKEFFSLRIYALVKRWPKCIELEGDYVE